MVIRPSILVVDDEPNSLFGICQVLTDEGFQTIPAKDGREALEKLKTNSVSLIITDEKMPDLSGMELLSEVKKTHPHIPLIADRKIFPRLLFFRLLRILRYLLLFSELV